MKILGKKNTRRVNKLLKGVLSGAGTIGRKTGHYVEAIGKGGMIIGGLSGQPEVAALAGGVAAAGVGMQDAGVVLRHKGKGIMKS